METRRSLLLTLAAGFATVGAGAAIWPLIDSLAPSSAELASGAPLDIDLAHIQPGSQKVIQWRGSRHTAALTAGRRLQILGGSQDLAILLPHHFELYGILTSAFDFL